MSPGPMSICVGQPVAVLGVGEGSSGGCNQAVLREKGAVESGHILKRCHLEVIIRSRWSEG